MTAVTLTAMSGDEFLAASARKRLVAELAVADQAYTLAVQAAVGGYGDWAHARQAGEVVRQCRAALKAAGEEL